MRLCVLIAVSLLAPEFAVLIFCLSLCIPQRPRRLFLDVISSSRAAHKCSHVLKPLPPVHDHLPYFWNSQSLLSRGQTWRVFSHREMQWKWKACYILRPHRSAPGSVEGGGEGALEHQEKTRKSYVADSPGDCAFLAGSRGLVCLAFDTCGDKPGGQCPSERPCFANGWAKHVGCRRGSRSVHKSMMWFRQMAQLSTTISHAQRATAFHYRANKGVSMAFLSYLRRPQPSPS